MNTFNINNRAARPRLSRIGPRRILTIAALTLAWCGMWQRVSVANVASGLVLAIAVLSIGVGTSGIGTVRIVPLIRLVSVVLVDLVKSTIDVAKEILTPNNTIKEAIVAVEIPAHAKQHFLLLIVAITLTPGTAVVDADPDTGTLYLHLLHYERTAEVKAHVYTLADLANQALPVSTRTTNIVRSTS